MSTNENDNVPLSKTTVDDSEHVDNSSTDVQSSNQESTEHAKSSVTSKDSEPITDEPIDANGNKEEAEESTKDRGDVIESGKHVEPASKLEKPEIVDVTETGEHKVAGASKTSDAPHSTAVQTSSPSLADMSAQTSSPSLADMSAQTSNLQLKDAASQTSPSSADSIQAKDSGGGPDASTISLPRSAESPSESDPVNLEKHQCTEACSLFHIEPSVDLEPMAEDFYLPWYLRSIICSTHIHYNEIIPVLSPDLPVTEVLKAVVRSNVYDRRGVPLWNPGEGYVGMFTPTDIVKVLRIYYYRMPDRIGEMANLTARACRQMTETKHRFISVQCTESLLKATKLLIEERVHRLPVLDDSNKVVFTCLTKRLIVRDLVQNFIILAFGKTNTPSFFCKTILELKIGTFEDIATINKNARVIYALDLLITRNVSSLPIVDENGKMTGFMFTKNVVFQILRNNRHYNLDVTIEAFAHAWEQVPLFTTEFTLGHLMKAFSNEGLCRIVMVEDGYDGATLVGIVSLSDVLKFLVMDPLGKPNLPFPLER